MFIVRHSKYVLRLEWNINKVLCQNKIDFSAVTKKKLRHEDFMIQWMMPFHG